MVDGANAVSSKTRAREGGTNMARSVIEIVALGALPRPNGAVAAGRARRRPALEDVEPGSGLHNPHRGLEYVSTLTVCSLDDPKDGLGDHNGPVAYCATRTYLPPATPPLTATPMTTSGCV